MTETVSQASDAWQTALRLVEEALEPSSGLTEYQRMQLSVGVLPHLHQAIGDLQSGAEPAEVARIRGPLPGLLDAFADADGALVEPLATARAQLASGLAALSRD